MLHERAWDTGSVIELFNKCFPCKFRFLMEEMMIKHTEMEGFSESMRQAASNPEAIHLKQQSTVLATQSGCGC